VLLFRHLPFVVSASKSSGSRDRRCAPGRSSRSVSLRSTAACLAASWRLGAAPGRRRRQRRDRRGCCGAVRSRYCRPDPRQILWRITRQDLFAPALAQVGLAADRVIYVDAYDEKSVLASFGEGVRHGGLGAVVAEVARLSMTSSRRLSLAAEASGSMAIAIRRWRRQTEAADFGQPTASATMAVSALPSAPLPGVGRAQWLLELIRCRARESADFVVGACDA
jgi:hypothetical protein